MKILIIDGALFGDVGFNESSLDKKGLGGSETWIVELARTLVSSYGHSVTVMSYSDHGKYSGLSQSGVLYVPKENLQYLDDKRYDHVIITRAINKQINEYFSTHRITDHITLMLHDLFSLFCDTYDFRNVSFEIDKVVCVSDWHVDQIKSIITGIPDDKFMVIPNGLNLSYFPQEAFEQSGRDNEILWSSCDAMGIEDVIRVGKLVREVVPDFKIRYATYDASNMERLSKRCDTSIVEYIGSLNKADLYKEMSKHKVYMYPCVKPETHCLSVIEQTICGAYPLTPQQTGLSYTFRYFSEVSVLPAGISNPEPAVFKEVSITDNDVRIYADIIIDVLTNYPEYLNKLNEMRSFFMKVFDWQNIASYWNMYFQGYTDMHVIDDMWMALHDTDLNKSYLETNMGTSTDNETFYISDDIKVPTDELRRFFKDKKVMFCTNSFSLGSEDPNQVNLFVKHISQYIDLIDYNFINIDGSEEIDLGNAPECVKKYTQLNWNHRHALAAFIDMIWHAFKENYDYVIYIDEDAFLLKDNLYTLKRCFEDFEKSGCVMGGMTDAGCLWHRTWNSALVNTYFSIWNIKMLRDADVDKTFKEDLSDMDKYTYRYLLDNISSSVIIDMMDQNRRLSEIAAAIRTCSDTVQKFGRDSGIIREGLPVDNKLLYDMFFANKQREMQAKNNRTLDHLLTWMGDTPYKRTNLDTDRFVESYYCLINYMIVKTGRPIKHFLNVDDWDADSCGIASKMYYVDQETNILYPLLCHTWYSRYYAKSADDPRDIEFHTTRIDNVIKKYNL